MGTILTSYGDAGYDHEGYPAQILDDGSTTAIHSDQTRARMVGLVIAACSCGWTGTTRYATTAAIDVDAEELAMQEWEHEHARPVLIRDQGAKWDQLRMMLQLLGTAHRDRLTDAAPRGLTVHADRDPRYQLDTTLSLLSRATELAHELRDIAEADSAGTSSPTTDQRRRDERQC